jgi:hypothetical protein
MDEIKKENELWREAKIVTKAAHLGLALQPSHFSIGTWIACCPGTNHTLELQPKRNLFYCGYCRVGGGIDELDEFVAQRRSAAAGFIGGRTLHCPAMEPCLTRTGDLVPTCQPVQIAEQAKSETYNDRN